VHHSAIPCVKMSKVLYDICPVTFSFQSILSPSNCGRFQMVNSRRFMVTVGFRSCPRPFSPLAFLPIIYTRFSCPPFVPHVPAISSSSADHFNYTWRRIFYTCNYGIFTGWCLTAYGQPALMSALSVTDPISQRDYSNPRNTSSW
jgi:hypothetical protein